MSSARGLLSSLGEEMVDFEELPDSWPSHLDWSSSWGEPLCIIVYQTEPHSQDTANTEIIVYTHSPCNGLLTCSTRALRSWCQLPVLGRRLTSSAAWRGWLPLPKPKHRLLPFATTTGNWWTPLHWVNRCGSWLILLAKSRGLTPCLRSWSIIPVQLVAASNQAEIYVTVHSLQEDLLTAHRTWRRSCRGHRATGHDGLNCRDFPNKMLRCKLYTGSYLRPFSILLAEVRSGYPFRMSTSGPTHVERTQGSTRNYVRDASDHSDWSEWSGYLVWVWTIATWRLLLSMSTCTYSYMYTHTHANAHSYDTPSHAGNFRGHSDWYPTALSHNKRIHFTSLQQRALVQTRTVVSMGSRRLAKPSKPLFLIISSSSSNSLCFPLLPQPRVDLKLPGVDVVGGYSITSPPHQLKERGTFNLAIQYSDHAPTLWMSTKCKVGDKLSVQVGGDFWYSPPSPWEVSDLLLIGGGVGINPLFSILQHHVWMLQSPGCAGSQGYNLGAVQLLYSSKTASELLFKVGCSSS